MYCITKMPHSPTFVSLIIIIIRSLDAMYIGLAHDSHRDSSRFRECKFPRYTQMHKIFMGMGIPNTKLVRKPSYSFVNFVVFVDPTSIHPLTYMSSQTHEGGV